MKLNPHRPIQTRLVAHDWIFTGETSVSVTYRKRNWTAIVYWPDALVSFIRDNPIFEARVTQWVMKA